MHREELTPAVMSAMPIFPLPDCVLLPGGLLPLHVFEPRYREMTRDCLAGAKLMAIARLRAGYEADYLGRPPVYTRVGIGRVLDSEEQSDGRFLIVLGGIARAGIVNELPPRRSYREVEARVLIDTETDPGRLSAAHEQLIALCDHIAMIVEGGDALRQLVRSGPPGKSADAVAAAIARDPDERQELLECQCPHVRLERALELAGALLSKLSPYHN
jgi:Lon protease-like protein